MPTPLKRLTACATIALASALGHASPAGAVDPAQLAAADQNPNDWLTYHGSYKSYHYSLLDQINADNIKQLAVAWTHFPGRSTRGLQSMPLVADGVLYYSGSYSRRVRSSASAVARDPPRPCGERRHVDPQVVRLMRASRAPDLLQELAVRDHLAGVAREQREELVLGRREWIVRAADR